MADTDNKQAGERFAEGKAYSVKVDGHRNKGAVINKGDKLTPKSEGQYNFLKTNGVI